MNSMVERAAEAIAISQRVTIGNRRARRLADARAALQAALDPGDEAIRAALLAGMGFYSDRGKFSDFAQDQAKGGIAALRVAAQEQKPHD